ncbi:Os08g0369400, partial [Oryza sativa Japonica Group]
ATARLSRAPPDPIRSRPDRFPSPWQITAPSTRIPRFRVAGLHSRRPRSARIAGPHHRRCRPRSARIAGPHHRRRRPRSPSICTAPDEFNPCAALLECECKNSAAAENTLLRAGYGGWLLYSAASAGDMAFVQELMDRDPLLVFGEGEHGVMDMFYAAARGGNAEVFKLLLDHAMSPRCSTNCPNGEGAGAVVAAPRCSGWK